MTSLSRPSLESQGWQTTEMDRRPHSRKSLADLPLGTLVVHHRPFEDLPLRLRRHSLPSRHRRGHPLEARAADHVSAHRCASSQPPEQCRGESCSSGLAVNTDQPADERRNNRADTVLGVAHLRRMRGASAAYARCICSASAVHLRRMRGACALLPVLIGSDERCKHRRLLGSENPSGQRSCSSRVDTPRLRCASPAGYAAATVPIRRSSTATAPRRSAAEVLPRPVVRSRSRAASGTRTRRGIRGCCRWLYGWRFEHLMRSVAAVYWLSRRSVRLCQCRDAHAVITRASSACSQQAEGQGTTRAASEFVPAAPPVVLTDVRRILCPDLVACPTNANADPACATRSASRLLRKPSSQPCPPSRQVPNGRAPAPSCTASRDGCGHLCSQHRDHSDAKSVATCEAESVATCAIWVAISVAICGAQTQPLSNFQERQKF